MNCGNFRTMVTTAEALRGWIRCSCGKLVKIKANAHNEAYVPRHKTETTKR